MTNFPSDSDGKEFACNAENTGAIPGLGRSPGETNDDPVQYSWMENSMDRGTWWATVHGVAKSQTQTNEFHFPKNQIPNEVFLTLTLEYEIFKGP